MRGKDIFKMCVQNLRRRRGRTFLTVLGVIIGCCAIVIMVSIGVGMNESQEKMLAQMGDLTIITVMPGSSDVKLNDEAMDGFKAIDGVEVVTPKVYFQYSASLKAGLNDRYECMWTNLVGIDTEAIPKMGYELLDGDMLSKAPAMLLTDSAPKINVLAGQNLAYNFMDTMRPQGANTIDRWSYMDWNTGEISEDIPDPYFDPMSGVMTLTIDTGEKKFDIEVTTKGVTKEDYSRGYETSESLIMSLDDMKSIILKAEGKTSKEFTYDNVIVKVKDITLVSEIEKQIKGMGYYTSSMESIREPMEKEARQKQLILGGLGAISLFVAALGIMNTMIMSISERTKEIGVMKALGCFVKDIRLIFLSEAGAIGLLGGLAGCVISFVASAVINLFSIGPPNIANIWSAISGSGDVTRVSIIPPWLYAFSIVFSIAVGLVSGFYPANKAVRISALEAIKNE